MLKDNENIPFFGDEPLMRSEPQGFAPDQMVSCEECLRTNPPTRLSCLYCAAPLPVSEETANLLKPSLKPVDDNALGYNNIFLPQTVEISEEALSDAAGLLKLDPKDLCRLTSREEFPVNYRTEER